MNDPAGRDPDADDPLAESLADWLVRQALRDAPLEWIYEGTCKQLHAAGIPVARAHVTFSVLHPLFQAQSLQWYRDREVEARSYRHGADPEAWERSPLFYMITEGVPHLRRHLVGEAAMLDFPLLEDLKDEGLTDYVAFVVSFSDHISADEPSNGIAGSWATDRASGFSNADIRTLHRMEQRLAVACKIAIQRRITENILSAYLGPGAGTRVLKGQIKRGDGDSIHAAIWYSDMRDSTRLADSMTGPAFLEVLNQYFECSAGAVLQHGGEVLRFVGDAVLAIFPIQPDADAASACRQAMRAVETARRRLAGINAQRVARGAAALEFGTGLHVGEVLFGNIGVPERVEFSVVGAAANEVARLESLTKVLQHHTLVSEVFARHLDLDWIGCGRHALRGVGEKVGVYAPPALS